MQAKINDILNFARHCGCVCETSRLYEWNRSFFDDIRKQQSLQAEKQRAVQSAANPDSSDPEKIKQISQELSQWLQSQDLLPIHPDS